MTYKASDCSSSPIYSAIRSPADTIIIMPTVASATSTGYSNRSKSRRSM